MKTKLSSLLIFILMAVALIGIVLLMNQSSKEMSKKTHNAEIHKAQSKSNITNFSAESLMNLFTKVLREETVMNSYEGNIFREISQEIESMKNTDSRYEKSKHQKIICNKVQEINKVELLQSYYFVLGAKSDLVERRACLQ